MKVCCNSRDNIITTASQASGDQENKFLSRTFFGDEAESCFRMYLGIELPHVCAVIRFFLTSSPMGALHHDG
jgi:hypothetical protein